MNCYHAQCGRELGAGAGNSLYCVDHWRDLTGKLEEVLEFIGRGATSIYVGRSNYPERRLLEHLRDREHDKLSVLHWSANRFEIEDVEKILIAYTKRRFPLKGENRDDESSGRLSGPWNAAYVSWKEKSKTLPIPVRWRAVAHLDEVPLAPQPGFLAFPVFLQATAERARVNEILERRYGKLRQ